MPIFEYKAYGSGGGTTAGVIDADTARLNDRGDSAHHRYKARQRARERERLERRREKLVSQLEQSRRKLANPKFVSRAPPEVVETERRRASEVESELELLEENVRALHDI